MANPKKIGDEGRALTCDEYDENLDILQDRANHIGTQDCASTITGLDACLEVNPVIISIEADITNNTNRITQIEDDLSATGSIANDLSVLEATLRAEIQDNTDSITVNLNTIDNTLTPGINANASDIFDLTQTVDNNFNNLEPRLTALDDDLNNGRMKRAEDDIDVLEGQVNTIVNSTIPNEVQNRINGDDNLDNKIDDEIQDRISEITRIENLLNDEVNDRIQADSTVDSKFTIITDSHRIDIDNEIQDRIDADALLQAQINTLTGSLGDAIPTGTILAYAGTTIPSGFLYCDGGSHSRTTYSALFAVVSTRYGSANASSFSVPDLRDRIPFGALSTNLNINPTYQFSNLKNINENNLPSHTHTSGVGDHTHTVDTTHYHGLSIQAHDHSIGNLPDHSHTLSPFRTVALGGGNEDDSGGELTSVQSDDPNQGNNYPNTALNGPVAGPAVGSTTIGIYPPPFTGINRTDDAGGVLTTSNGGSSSGDTGATGGSVVFDVRQASVGVNFIIKT